MSARSQAVASEHDKRPGGQFLGALVIGAACWLMPHQGVISTLLPQRLSEIDPQNKVSLLVVFSTTAMIVALVSNFVMGALSDVTRSRLGKRTPWVVGCSILSCLILFLVGTAPNVPLLLFYWCIYEVVVNGVAAAMAAQMSDRVSVKWRGTAASAYAIGQTIGVQLGLFVAAQFLADVTIGIWVFALVALVGGLISAWLTHEGSNLDEARDHQALSAKAVLSNLRFPPLSGAADFYKSLVSRFIYSTATVMISSYMLYIVKDYLALHEAAARDLLSVNSVIMLVSGLIFGAFIGPLSDRLGRSKSLIVIATPMVAVGALIPLVLPTSLGLIIYACVVGIVGGANSTLIQTVSLKVLPSAQTAAKDLGILNLSNTLGGVAASILGGALINVWGYGSLFVGAAVGLILSIAFVASIKSVR